LCLLFNSATSKQEIGMDLQGASTSGTSGAALELASLKLAKNQQEQEGQASLQLLESAADVPTASAGSASIGGNIDTFV
jgi:hypothetical protein